MVDIAKSPSLGQKVIELFFPNLIPGESLVIQQDYHHPLLPHIHVTMEYLADYFDLVAPRVDDSAVFRLRSAIPERALRRAITYDFSFEEQQQLIESAIRRLQPEDRFYAELAGIVLRSKHVNGDLLRAELDALEQQFNERELGYTRNPYFEDVRISVDMNDGWRQLALGNYERSLEIAENLLKRGRDGWRFAMRGCALSRLGRYAEAEQDLRDALEMRPLSGYTYIELARSLLHQGRFDEAEAGVLRGVGDKDAIDAGSGEYLDVLKEVLTARNDPQKDAATMARLRIAIPDSQELQDLEAELSQRSAGADAEDAGDAQPYADGTAAFSAEKPWTRLALPAEVTSVRSMLDYQEQQYLTWLTSEKFENRGAIVELGCWLGSGSVALAEGLRRRGSQAVIHSFDLFRWEPFMRAAADEPLSEGDDFLPLYLKETSAYARFIQPHKQDLMNYTWDGGPIELLFVDSAKTWDLLNAVLRGFGNHLIPGFSRVVLQDFRFPYAHCLPLVFDSRPDIWLEAEVLDDVSAAVFTPLRPLGGPGGIQPDYSEDCFPLASAEHLLRKRMARESAGNQYFLFRTLYRKYLIDGPVEAARRLREQAIAEGATPAELACDEDIEFIVGPRGWRALEQGDLAGAKAAAERCLSLPGKRTIHGLTLLGFALLRLGDRVQAVECMNEVRSMAPDFAPARLFFAELALNEGRYSDCESEALTVLRSGALDDSTVRWALNIMAQSCARPRSSPESSD